jgi:hypothetical protein
LFKTIASVPTVPALLTLGPLSMDLLTELQMLAEELPEEVYDYLQDVVYVIPDDRQFARLFPDTHDVNRSKAARALIHGIVVQLDTIRVATPGLVSDGDSDAEPETVTPDNEAHAFVINTKE